MNFDTCFFDDVVPAEVDQWLTEGFYTFENDDPADSFDVTEYLS